MNSVNTPDRVIGDGDCRKTQAAVLDDHTHITTHPLMDGSGDVEPHIIPERATKHAPHRSFDFDDAFGDDDRDLNTHFKFNSESIREELAARREAEEIANETNDDHYGHENHGDQSVSTIDIGGPALSAEDEDPLPSPSVDGTEFSNDFSRVSLSDHSHHAHDFEQEAEHNDQDIQPEAEYPMVHIDASDHPSSTVVQGYELNIPQDSYLEPKSRSSESSDQLRTPPHSAPASSSNTSFTVPPPNDPPSSSSLNVPTTSQDTKPKHRPTRSMVGPSALEKVMSRTRPTFLPPKPKDEDNRHLADWENIMRQSRAAGMDLLSIFFSRVYSPFTL